MKIIANGYLRNVVGDHVVTDKPLDDSVFHPVDGGIEIVVSRTNKIALSGNFTLHIRLSTAEVHQAMDCATIKRLENRIKQLEAKITKK